MYKCLKPGIKKKCAIREYYDLSCNLNPKLFLRQMLKSDGEFLGKPDEILRVILRWTSIQGGVVTLLVASCQGDRDKLRLGGLSLNTDFAFDRGMI